MAPSGGKKKTEKPKEETKGESKELKEESKRESKEESFKELLIAVSKGDSLAETRFANKVSYITSEEIQALFKPLWEELKDSSDSSVDRIVLKGIICYCLIDYRQAMNFFKEANKNKNFVAEHFIGKMYCLGLGVEKNYDTAISFYREAANKGYPPAQNSLGVTYERGDGVLENPATAREWYQKSAEQGNAGAQFNLGNMYRRGRGVSVNFITACEWYQKAAEQGYPHAQFNLGSMYDLGHGVSVNFITACEWYRKSIEGRYDCARSHLNVLYTVYTVTNDPKISNEIKSTIIYHAALALSFSDGKELPDNVKRDFQALVNTQPKLFLELMNADYLDEDEDEKMIAPIEESAIGKRVKNLLGAELNKRMMEDRERYFKVIAQKRHALLVRGFPDGVADIVLSGVFRPHILSAVDPVSKELEHKIDVRQKNENINNIINRLLSGEEKLTEKTTETLNEFVKEMQAKKEDSIAADEWSRLGLISFLNGEPVESLECLNNALKKGATDARVYYYLSKLYSDGKAVKSDSGKEKQYFTEAVKRGHPEANFIFGKECDRCYRDKKEPTYSRMRDFKEARQCFEKAKNEGHAEAAYYLARLHESNLPEIGVSADLRSAKECYTFAAERGFEKAKTALKKFEAPATARSRR